MMKGLIAKKLGMTQIFSEDGRKIPVTVLQAGPCVVLQVKTAIKDGYSAVQLGFDSRDSAKSTKPLVGHCSKAGAGPMNFIREFRVSDEGSLSVGDSVTVDTFAVGDIIDVTGTSIGKGYQGVIKRWGFQGGRSSHGSRFHRAPGSIGCSATPSRVLKNKKMPGQMGNKKSTIQRLQIVSIDNTDNLLMVKGAVPGPANGLVMIKESVKTQK